MSSLDLAILLDGFCHRTGKRYLRTGETRDQFVESIVAGLDCVNNSAINRLGDTIDFLADYALGHKPETFEAARLLDAIERYKAGRAVFL